MAGKAWAWLAVGLLAIPALALLPEDRAPSAGPEANHDAGAGAAEHGSSTVAKVDEPWLELGELAPGAPAEVGEQGNEPFVLVAPDGTIYVSALQYLYRSVDGGATFELRGPTFTQHLSLASDSALAMDPEGRLYMVMNAPYAGNTEVCSSANRGDSWFCQNLVLPAPTDRQWIVAPRADAVYVVTNYGLYQTVMLRSADHGLTWVPVAASQELLAPQTGPLRPHPSGALFQSSKAGGLVLYRWDTGLVAPVAETLDTGFSAPLALPSLAVTSTGALVTATERVVDGGGRESVVLVSTDEGATWRGVPVPRMGYGTWTFSWATAGPANYVGMVAYASVDAGSPGSMATSTWHSVWVETSDITAATPTWSLRVLESGVHVGSICIAISCSGSNRYSGDYIGAEMGPGAIAHVVWMRDTHGGPEIRYAHVP